MVQDVYADFSKWFPFFFIFHASEYQIDNEETIAPLLPIIVSSIDGYIHTVRRLVRDLLLERINVEASVNPQILIPDDWAQLDNVLHLYLYSGLYMVLEDG